MSNFRNRFRQRIARDPDTNARIEKKLHSKDGGGSASGCGSRLNAGSVIGSAAIFSLNPIGQPYSSTGSAFLFLTVYRTSTSSPLQVPGAGMVTFPSSESFVVT